MSSHQNINFQISVNYRDTVISALRYGETVWQSTLSTGGVDWVIALINYMVSHRTLLIGRRTAETMIKDLLAYNATETTFKKIARGRSSIDGQPDAREVTEQDVFDSFYWPLQSLAGDIVQIFTRPEKSEDGNLLFPARTPSELRSAIEANPIILTGEFAGIELSHMLENKIGFPIIFHKTINDENSYPSAKL